MCRKNLVVEVDTGNDEGLQLGLVEFGWVLTNSSRGSTASIDFLNTDVTALNIKLESSSENSSVSFSHKAFFLTEDKKTVDVCYRTNSDSLPGKCVSYITVYVNNEAAGLIECSAYHESLTLLTPPQVDLGVPQEGKTLTSELIVENKTHLPALVVLSCNYSNMVKYTHAHSSIAALSKSAFEFQINVQRLLNMAKRDPVQLRLYTSSDSFIPFH